MLLTLGFGRRKRINSMQIFVRFFRDESGVSAIEYALVGGIISIACIGAMSTIGDTLLGFYIAIQTALVGAL